MHCSRFALSHLLARTAALAIGLASAWACGSPNTGDDCPQGSDGCACALGFCDDGLACIADMCVADGTTTDSSITIEPTTTNPATTDASEDSSSDDGATTSTTDADSSSSGEPPSTDPIFDATIDGVPTSFDNDPHSYVGPAGIVITRGDASNGAGGELILRFPPTGPGTYDCVLDETTVAIYWTTQGPMGPLEMSSRTTGECTITVDEYGEVGEMVSGTFSGEVRFPGSELFPPSTFTDGIFRVPRTPDE